MTVENRLLRKMYGMVKEHGYDLGIYIEGIEGGVVVYATDGKALYRKTLAGDNHRQFFVRIGAVKERAGFLDPEEAGTGVDAEMAAKIRALSGETPDRAFTANGADFFRDVKTVSENPAETGPTKKNRDIVFSFHDGFLDLASWPSWYDDACLRACGEVCAADGLAGAFSVERKYLDGLKTKGALHFGLHFFTDGVRLHIGNGGTDVVMAVRDVGDEYRRFARALGYEYRPPAAVAEKAAGPEAPCRTAGDAGGRKTDGADAPAPVRETAGTPERKARTARRRAAVLGAVSIVARCMGC